MRRLCFALLSLSFLGVSSPARTVSVAYAGSLVTTMEGPIASSLPVATGLQFAGEAKGSRALANLIRAGLRHPDVFISADASLVESLAQVGLIQSSRTFGGASMVIGYGATSRHRALFEDVAKGKRTLLSVLETPGLRLARTDPKLDPKGARSVLAMHLLAGARTAARILGADDNPSQIFPEEDLLVRLETGEADAAFLYSTEARARHIPAVSLPGDASLSHVITYTVAIMKHAPHPTAAKTFVDFILTGKGRAILEEAGVKYF